MEKIARLPSDDRHTFVCMRIPVHNGAAISAKQNVWFATAHKSNCCHFTAHVLEELSRSWVLEIEGGSMRHVTTSNDIELVRVQTGYIDLTSGVHLWELI